jgi:hypothetical protein
MHRVLWLLFLSAAAAAASERINHEGRILGELPAVTQPLLFNTPAADSVVAAMQTRISPAPVPSSAWPTRMPQRRNASTGSPFPNRPVARPPRSNTPSLVPGLSNLKTELRVYG